MSDKYIDVIIADKPTRDKILGAAATGGLGYTDADGTVHKIDSDYIEGGGGGGASVCDIEEITKSETVEWTVSAKDGVYADVDITLIDTWSYESGLPPSLGIVSITVDNVEHEFYPYSCVFTEIPDTSIDGLIEATTFAIEDENDNSLKGVKITKIALIDTLVAPSSTTVGIKAIAATPNAATYAFYGIITN